MQSKHGDKLDKEFVRLKFCRDPTSEKSDPYDFKMTLFDNEDPEEFSLFVLSFNMTLPASETLETAAKVQYLCMLVCGESLSQFDLLYADV